VAGSTLSIFLALLLEMILPYVILLLVAPLEFLFGSFGDLFSSGGPDVLERLFFSPVIIVFLVVTALEAPIPEEFAKGLGVVLFGRQRITSERQAFAVGLASGAGFAILENMLYEGLYAQYNGWSWGGVTLLRSLGAVLHPLCAGLVALGWFRMRAGGSGRLFKAYFAAVGLHTLWNGGFALFLYFTGLDYFSGPGPSLSLYGTAVETLLVIFLAALSLALWWLLRRMTAGLAQGAEPDLAPMVVSARALAGLALASAFIIVPIGAALTGSWPSVAEAVVAGPAPTQSFTPSASSTPTLAPTRTPAPTSTRTPAPTSTPFPPMATRPTWTPGFATVGVQAFSTPPAAWPVKLSDSFNK
jgi:hypothetical protein